jgi:signal transduction histidine kinase
MLEQTVTNINQSLSSIDQYYQYLLSNRLVLKGLQNENFGTNPLTYDAVIYLKDLMYSLIKTHEELDSALYISRKGQIISNLSGMIYPELFDFGNFQQQESVKAIYRNPSIEVWYLDDIDKTNRLYYMRGIRDPQSGTVLGILVFMIHQDAFLRLIQNLSTPGGGVFICNSEGIPFISSTLNGRVLPVTVTGSLEGEPVDKTIEEKDFLYVIRSTENCWYVISQIPMKTLSGDLRKILQWGLIISIVLVLFGGVISFYISQRYTRDLTSMVDVMESNSIGNMELLSIRASNVEFRTLATTYNRMINGLRDLTRSLQREVDEKTKADLALQSLNETLEGKVAERTEQLASSLVQLQQTQSELIEKEKMASLGSLVAGMAHELNTPIGVCVTAASHHQSETETIHNDYNRNGSIELEKFVRYLDDSIAVSDLLMSNLNRLSELINSFKLISVDQTYEVVRRINLKEYAESLILSLSPEIKKVQAETEVECSPDLFLKTYPGSLGQILTNFIINSVIHGFNGTKNNLISISITESTEFLTLRYSDNGKGMSDEVRSRIFEPFFTTNRGKGGTGLGLHLVYNLVSQRFKGSMVCNSTPGEGTVFILTFPRDHAFS